MSEPTTQMPVAEPQLNAEPPAAPTLSQVPETPVMSKEDAQAALTKDYTDATKWLREKHQAEFDAKRVELAAARGIEWTPRPSKADKAKAEIARLAAELGYDVTLTTAKPEPAQ